jgi:uncharacterized protein YjbJ (UPF0337 family)
MLYKFINSKWQMVYGNTKKWVAQRRQAQLIKNSNKHEQYVSIIQKRYGYTKEKATDELKKHYKKVKFC